MKISYHKSLINFFKPFHSSEFTLKFKPKDFIRSHLSINLEPMDCCFASFNTKGFQSSLDSGKLPESDHITYEGAFNELTFTIGKKAQKSMELHLGYSRCQHLNSSFDSDIHDYLAIFTKGSKDGQDRDHRILNSVVCLDISGSMNSGLTSNDQSLRLNLAKQAIKMFFSKLRQTDSFGLVVFAEKAKTLIPSQLKTSLNPQNVFTIVDSIKAGGGTTLMSGFQESRQNLVDFLQAQNYVKATSAAENRILMLTDVGDNSMTDATKFVEEVAHSQNIHTTIIGVSDDFISSTCEKMNEVQGFNYFCATEVEDLKKYLFENFNFTFFPSNYDIQIDLIENKNVQSIEVYGTVDSKRVKEYNNNFVDLSQNIAITKTKTSFPSQIELTKEGVLKQYGGLVIVKLNLTTGGSNKFETKVRLSYTNSAGQKEEEVYSVSFEVPGKEQFYSEECLAEAMPAFFYVHEVKNILVKLNQDSYNRSRKERAKYAANLQELKPLCPSSKLKELKDMIKVLKDSNEEQDQF